MSPSRKLICAAAAMLAIVIPAGCASTSHHAAQPRTRTAPDPAVTASTERQMIGELQTGSVQLGASDGLGRSLHDRHMFIALARHVEGSDAYAGVDSSSGGE